MKWYWWLIIVLVPLGFVAYFFYKAGQKVDAAAHAREHNPKNNPALRKDDPVNSVDDPDLKVNE